MIKIIAFDFRGVIAFPKENNFFERLLFALDISKEKWKSSYSKFNKLTNVGNFSWPDVARMAIADLSVGSEQVAAAEVVLQDFKLDFYTNDELLTIILLLKEKDYSTALITNFGKEFDDVFNSLNLSTYFDQVIVSYKVGFQKPEKEIFYALANAFSVQLSEIVIVDDTQKSLESADELGFVPLLFTSNEDFRIALDKILNE